MIFEPIQSFSCCNVPRLTLRWSCTSTTGCAVNFRPALNQTSEGKGCEKTLTLTDTAPDRVVARATGTLDPTKDAKTLESLKDYSVVRLIVYEQKISAFTFV